MDRTPDQLKLPFYLWTREAVAQLIERRFGIRLSIWTVGRYLARWSFTPQKPMSRSFEQKPKTVKHWLKKNVHHIRLFFLPNYSPELNPDEVLNQGVKSNAVGRRRAENQQKLLSDVRSY